MLESSSGRSSGSDIALEAQVLCLGLLSFPLTSGDRLMASSPVGLVVVVNRLRPSVD